MEVRRPRQRRQRMRASFGVDWRGLIGLIGLTLLSLHIYWNALQSLVSGCTLVEWVPFLIQRKSGWVCQYLQPNLLRRLNRTGEVVKLAVKSHHTSEYATIVQTYCYSTLASLTHHCVQLITTEKSSTSPKVHLCNSSRCCQSKFTRLLRFSNQRHVGYIVSNQIYLVAQSRYYCTRNLISKHAFFPLRSAGSILL